MNTSISANTKSILLLTAPLMTGRGESSSSMLTPREYNRLETSLRNQGSQPADLLEGDFAELIKGCGADLERLERLLSRSFILSEVIERWESRAMWVVSREDSAYPRRLKDRLKEHAPALLYGCGDQMILEDGGLAIVGSRNVDDALIESTKDIGRLAAESHCIVFSGAARGIDQAAMLGALEAGGKVGGVMADSLERAAVAREHREFLMEQRLVLVSPYDPAAGFNVGHAMQRNKLIYALADAALVMSSDFEKGGTWAGAVEQLKKLRFVPVFVHESRDKSEGLEALKRMGALIWPDSRTPEAFAEALTVENGAAEERLLFT
ncbi:MAG: DNA-processing protein DprA [Acidobacteriota bacterium]